MLSYVQSYVHGILNTTVAKVLGHICDRIMAAGGSEKIANWHSFYEYRFAMVNRLI